jgi:transcription antitermination factor NusG
MPEHHSRTVALDGAWVAVQVHVNRERAAAENLTLLGYESFAPHYVPRSNAVRRCQREKPLLPGYLFVRYKTKYSVRIVEAAWVIRIVGVANAPVQVPDHEVQSIQRVVASGIYSEPWRVVQVGERVSVCRGPLAGLEGTLICVKKGLRLLVAVTFLQRSIAVEVGAADVLPAIWPTAVTIRGTIAC